MIDCVVFIMLLSILFLAFGIQFADYRKEKKDFEENSFVNALKKEKERQDLKK